MNTRGSLEKKNHHMLEITKVFGGGERKIITSFNSRSNLVSGRSEPYLLIASAYVSLGKGFGNSTPLSSRKTCNEHFLFTPSNEHIF